MFTNYVQGRNHRENLVAISAMVGGIHYKKIMRFKKSPQLPGAGRTRAGHHHGSDTPTSPRAIYVLKSAKCNEIMPSVYLP